MFNKFYNIETEKQERIINAAIKEFAQKGYQNASTNEIVKQANISKGLLFHYFQNKKSLFLFLYDYTWEKINKEIFSKIDIKENDILLRYRYAAMYKFELVKIYPEMFNFMMTANLENSSEVKKDLESRTKEFIKGTYTQLFTNIDTSKFKKGIDVKRAINIIIWTMEGFSTQEQAKIKSLALEQINYDQILEEMDRYIELLRQALYHSEDCSYR